LESKGLQPFQNAEEILGSDQPLGTKLSRLMQIIQERIDHPCLVLVMKRTHLEGVYPLLDETSVEQMEKAQVLISSIKSIPAEPDIFHGAEAQSFFSSVGLLDHEKFPGPQVQDVVVTPLNSGTKIWGLFCMCGDHPFSDTEVSEFNLFCSQIANALYVEYLKLEEEGRKFEESRHALLFLDRKGIIVRANKAAADLLQYAAQEMDHTNLEIILPPKRVAEYQHYFRQVREEGHLSPLEIEFLAKDGTPVQLELSFTDTDSRYLQCTLIAPDRDEAFWKDYYETMIHTTEDMIYTLDLGGRFVFANRKATEVMGEDIVGKHFEEVVIPEFREMVKKKFESRKKGETSPVYKLQVFNKNREKMWLEISGTPFFQQGKVVGICGSARVITEKMQIEQQRTHLTLIANDILQRKNLREIMDTVAHAIRDHCGFERVIISLLDEHYEATNLAFAGLTEEEKIKAYESHLSPEQRKSIFSEEFKMGQSYYIPHDRVSWADMGVKSKLKPEQMKDWHPDDFLFIPLYREQKKVIGLVSVDDPVDGKVPAAENLAPVELFATQAAIAIENARLYEEINRHAELLESRVAERTRKREALLETSYRLREVTSWDKGMKIILEGITKGLGFRNAELFLINEARKVLENIAVIGDEKRKDIPLDDQGFVSSQCVDKKKPINIQGASRDERVKKQIEPVLENFAWVPIMTQDEVVGAISVYNKTSGEPITDDELDDLLLFANQAAHFVESTRFLITPAIEKTLDSRMKYNLNPGESYLIKDSRPTRAFDIFMDAVTHGIQGFSICRIHPKKVKGKYGLKKTPILWLSTIGTEDSIDPKDLAKINHMLNKFLKKAADSIILLEGVEYLIIQNSFEKVIKALHSLNDYITIHNSRLLIPVNPRTLDERELSILEKEFRVM